jgi:ACS family tartrate transporter-like MFS transporter
LPSRFLSGDPAAAGTALVVTIANIGGFTGPALIGFLKQQTGTHVMAFLFLAGFAAIATWLAIGLRRTEARDHNSESGDRR